MGHNTPWIRIRHTKNGYVIEYENGYGYKALPLTPYERWAKEFYEDGPYDSYIIYSPQNGSRLFGWIGSMDVNKAQADQLKYKSDVSKKKCKVIKVNSPEEFVNVWNKLSNGQIESVTVIAHGGTSREKNDKNYAIGYLYFDQEENGYFHAQQYTGMGKNDRHIGNLKQKSIEKLYFSACNTANKDFKKNIAQSFLKEILE